MNIPISKQVLRLLLGVLTLILPIILPLGQLLLGADRIFESSISSYYHTDVGIVFTIILFLFSLCFMLYGLKSRRYRLELIVTGILSLLIIIFPTHSSGINVPVWMGYAHIVCSGAFFALLGWMIRRIFNLPLPFPLLTKIGLYIWIALGLLIVYFFTFKSLWPPLVYVLETVILWLFTAGIFVRNKINKKLGS